MLGETGAQREGLVATSVVSVELTLILFQGKEGLGSGPRAQVDQGGQEPRVGKCSSGEGLRWGERLYPVLLGSKLTPSVHPLTQGS